MASYTERLRPILKELAEETITCSLKWNIERFTKDVESYEEAMYKLIEHKFYPLLDIADSLSVNRFNSLSVTLFIQWNQQTAARHLYGGCFPEQMERKVTIGKHPESCKDIVGRECTLDLDDGFSIRIVFYRRTFNGDVIDGCEVRFRSCIAPQYDYRDTYTTVPTLQCSMRG